MQGYVMIDKKAPRQGPTRASLMHYRPAIANTGIICSLAWHMQPQQFVSLRAYASKSGAGEPPRGGGGVWEGLWRCEQGVDHPAKPKLQAGMRPS